MTYNGLGDDGGGLWEVEDSVAGQSCGSDEMHSVCFRFLGSSGALMLRPGFRTLEMIFDPFLFLPKIFEAPFDEDLLENSWSKEKEKKKWVVSGFFLNMIFSSGQFTMFLPRML